MQRTAVGSTNIASIGFDDASQTLEIEFVSGGIYEYYGVPTDVFDSLMQAASIGSYFVHRIKNSFGCARIG